jgi:AcrR family transcriptional regulator
MARPQQARAVQTRQAILRAAAEVFDEYGYAGSGIQRIIERAGITSGALYFHFKQGKQELALEVMRSQPQSLYDIELESHGLQRVIDLTLVWSCALQDDSFLRAGVRLTGEQANMGIRDAAPFRVWVEIVQDCLSEAEKAGQLREDAQLLPTAEFLVGACTGTQEYALAVSNRADLTRRTVFMWRLLLPGIATEKAAAEVRLDELRARELYTPKEDPDAAAE